MKGIVEERAVELAEYIVENKTTVRAAAKQFGVSKSTVHMDVARRLRSLNPQLYSEVREILDINKAQRHIRGGLATREKYKSMKEENDKLQKLNDSYQQELAKLKEKFVSYIQMGTSLKVKDFPDMTKENLLLLIEEIKEKTDKGDYEAAESMILKSYVFVRFLEDEK